MNLNITTGQGLSRRNLLRVGGLGAAGLTLPAALRAAGGKATSCIAIFQLGGCCQLSSWDPKPEAPPEMRGSFGHMPTSLPGVHVSTLLPQCAKRMHKMALIRSMTSEVAIHDVAQRYMFSGTRPRTELQHPSFGAVLSREMGSRDGLPPFVVVPDRQAAAEAGFLGSGYDQFVAGDPKDKNYRVRDVALPDGMSFDEAVANKNLLRQLDSEFVRAEKSPLLDSMDLFYQKAFELVSSSSTRQAFQIEQEPAKLRDAYGRNTTGQGALLGRRLVEAGVRLVSVFQGGYDTHTGHEAAYKRILPEFDAAFSTLVDDLEQRGLLETTLVLGVGEFGRTPQINPAAGRDHWPGAWSMVMAGAGIEKGAVIGKTDARGAYPTERPVSIEDIGATIYKVFGIDYHKAYEGPNRPVPISTGVPVKEILA
ncbi:MAG: DUF1501 domain-containing protein [Acidobacteria bacterium]|nr:DUF1501 domain-containing protein [Acidobacteriota bacterium]